jgi:hypothetical protein
MIWGLYLLNKIGLVLLPGIKKHQRDSIGNKKSVFWKFSLKLKTNLKSNSKSGIMKPRE